MPTLPHGQQGRPEQAQLAASAQPHRARQVAESFGAEAQRYDRARPPYPDELVARIVAGSPGPDAPDVPDVPDVVDVLDVGCGTGIAARQLQAAGCAVLGIDPDPRMAALARARGLRVEVATFEDWEPAGRTFDAVVVGQAWHWVDPAVGAAKAARLLRPKGRLTIFGHVFEPPAEVAEPFAAAFRRVVPDSPFGDRPARRPLELYRAGYARTADDIRATGRFAEPEQWSFAWERSYTRDQWLDLLPTTGGLTGLRPAPLAEVLDAVGAAVDALGGRFTMPYTTLATSAALRAEAP
ncbi:class I SAM-dependent methyltransferase [Kitasatospora sp. NPDC059146]|uniref:class I SAM-dependent methyltransferase n=1 Tax=Kitasatospora sp. NPDC059146 TaxID=3346741 RepID=UPI0036B06E31